MPKKTSKLKKKIKRFRELVSDWEPPGNVQTQLMFLLAASEILKKPDGVRIVQDLNTEDVLPLTLEGLADARDAFSFLGAVCAAAHDRLLAYSSLRA